MLPEVEHSPGLGEGGGGGGSLSTYHIAENFHGFVAIHENFPREIWDVAFFGTVQASNPQKFSPSKIVFFTNLREFYLSKVSRYTVSVYMRVACNGTPSTHTRSQLTNPQQNHCRHLLPGALMASSSHPCLHYTQQPTAGRSEQEEE